MPVACTFDSIYVQPGTVGSGLGFGGSLTVTLWKSAGGTGTPTATTLGIGDRGQRQPRSLTRRK
jgi:hypothetical protein